MNLKLGNKAGILGLVLGILGFGGSSVLDLFEPAAVSPSQEETLSSLLDAVQSLQEAGAQVEKVPEVIGEKVEYIRRTANETAGEVSEQAAATVEDVQEIVQQSLESILVRAATGAAGILGTLLAAVGFRQGEGDAQ